MGKEYTDIVRKCRISLIFGKYRQSLIFLLLKLNKKLGKDIETLEKLSRFLKRLVGISDRLDTMDSLPDPLYIPFET